jgi:hypothetical protein
MGDDSYQAAYLGDNGRRLDRSAAGAATTARGRSDRPMDIRVLGVLTERLSGWIGARRDGAEAAIASALLAIALGLGMRTRRWMLRRLRRTE